VAAEWNECFKSAANRRDPEKLATFWTELKGRLLKKYGSLTAAFTHFKPAGEETMNFLDFVGLLRLTHLPLDQRTSRLLFEMASRGDPRISVRELKLALMERSLQGIRQALARNCEKKERINFCVQNFIGRIMQADESIRTQTVDRFQRKLTVPFCRELFMSLMCRLDASGKRDVNVSRVVLERALRDEFSGKGFRNHDVAYMLCIFDRIDTNAGYKPLTGNVPLLSLLAALMLLSPEPDRCLKVALLFEAYDSDEDGCLHYGQILALFQNICAQKPVADENTRGAKDFTFQEELALQEGMRYYERVRWCLQRDCHVVEGDLVAVREFWQVLQRLKQVLDEILPSMVKMRWLATDLQEGCDFGEDDAAADGWRRLSAESVDPTTGLTRPRRTSMRGVPKPFLADGGAPQPPVIGRKRTQLQQAIQASIAEMQVPNARAPERNVTFWSECEVEDSPMLTPRLPGPMKEPDFKEFVSTNFKQSLRTLAWQRLNDLNENFNSTVEMNGDPWDSSARTPQASLLLTDISTPGSPSCPAATKMRSYGSQGSLASIASRRTPPSKTRGAKMAGISTIDCEKWGVASTERFRLFCSMKACHGGGVPLAQDRQASPDPEAGIGFQCFLCHSFHTLNAGCSL